MRTFHPCDPHGFLASDTQRLVAYIDSTTALLEELLAEPVRVHTAELSSARIDETWPQAADLLRLPARAQVMVRRSVLATPTGRVVSSNLVLAAPRRAPWVEPLLSNLRTPLGKALATLPHRRLPPTSGLASWGDASEGDAHVAAAARHYAIEDLHTAAPVLALFERFNPAHFDPACAPYLVPHSGGRPYETSTRQPPRPAALTGR